MVEIFALVLSVVFITIGAMWAGWRLAMAHMQREDIRFFEEVTIEDWLSDTPIANALDRKFDV